MKNTFFLSIIVLLVTSTLVSAPALALPLAPASPDASRGSGQVRAAAEAGGDGYVPNEIIVKFRRLFADTVQAQPGQEVLSGSLNLSQDIEQLNTKYKVKRIEPLFKNFRQKNRQLRMLQRKSRAFLTQRENHIRQRLKRAPKGANVPELDRIYKIQVDPGQGQSLQDAVEAYRRSPDVEYAELNHIVFIDLVPDDPLYSLQWSLDKIETAGAWNTSVGSSDVVVAVIDTGVDYTHRDLVNNIWVNEAELNGTIGIDDDGNGYIDDIYGYDFFNYDPDPKDDYGHGTHVAGIIAAEGNNGRDMAGVCWDASIMAIKFIGAGGWGSTADAVEAFYYAVENGADIVSNSWGGDEFSEALRDVIDYAHSQGVIVVAAAGNAYSNLLQYPAGYENVIAVAATDSADQKASFSSYGDWVDIAAPGVDILSLRAQGTSMGKIHDDYTTVASGTSMACPHVAGACAFLLSVNATLTEADVYNILMNTVDPISPGICIANGRLNLFNAAMMTQGYISFDKDYYSCSDLVIVRLIDCGLQGRGAQDVSVAASGGDLETVVLTETAPVLGIFTGSVSIGSGVADIEDGILQVSDGQIITVTYDDLRDAAGNSADVTDTAAADCEGPVIFNVQIDAFGPEPTVYFETDEPAGARVRCGPACGGPYIIEAYDPNPAVNHTIKLRDVLPETDYFFMIEAVDAAGNKTIDDNAGQCYAFTTNKPGDVYVPAQYPTIQGGIDHCWNGGAVVVADGTYSGVGNYDIDFRGKGIVVTSENGPSDCIIDCGNKGRGFIFYRGEDRSSVIDGFTIRNGYPTVNFNPAVPQDLERGAGIYCLNSGFTITNCRFVENIASGVGGGVYCENGNIKVSNCTFERNRALTGAGISCRGSLVLTDCVITENTAEDGAGIEIFGDLQMKGCLVTDNRATGIFMQRNVLFVDGYGGGVRCYNGTTDISDCIISRNCGNFGGGLFYWNSNASISNCIITDNSALAGGGIGDNAAVGGVSYYYVTSGSSVITNCTISNNKAVFDNRRRSGGFGGGIVSGWKTTTRTTISNCILSGNTADEGRQIYIADSTYVIDPNDPNAPDPLDVMNRMNIFYSDIEDGRAGVYDTNSILTWGPGNIDSVPGFAFADDYHLLGSSLCIDGGTNEPNGGLPAADLDGIFRPLDGNGDTAAVADMGVYEFNNRLPSIAVSPSPLRFFCKEGQISVDTQILSIRNCGGGILSWHISEDCPWLQASKTSGICYRSKVDRVVLGVDSSGLSAGNYECELVVYDSRAANSPRIIPVRLHIRGNLRVPSRYPTIEAAINAAREGDVVLVEDGIYSGRGNRDISFYGKAITVRGENGPENCIIDCQGTEIEPHRGFVFLDGERADSIVDGLTIRAGYVSLDWFKIFPPFDGGGIYCYGSNPTIRNCIIRDNKAVGWGGGLFIFWSEDIQGISNIENCRLIGNYASGYGGGMWTDNDAVISNCVIEQNKSASRGGGLSCEFSCHVITNCTIVGNSASDYGGGIYAPWWWDEPHYLFVTNSIITDNTARNGPQIASKDGKLSISYSLVQGGVNDIYRDPGDILDWGQGNIDADPCFVRPGYREPGGWVEGDYHLQPGSPCIDAGVDAGIYNDIEGNVRPFDFPGVDNNGDLPDFDMGAYEATIRTKAKLLIFPQVINRHSGEQRIIALLSLPKDTLEQIDNSQPLLLYPGGIEASDERIIRGGRNSNWCINIIAFFDKAELMAAVPENGKVDLQVVGQLKTGQYFYGCDTVRIIDSRRQQLWH